MAVAALAVAALAVAARAGLPGLADLGDEGAADTIHVISGY